MIAPWNAPANILSMTSMSTITLLFGALLNIVGLVGYFGTGAAHPTALIPCALGLLLILCGLLARQEKLHMHVMHAAVLIALLGFGGTVTAFTKFSQVILHGTEGNGSALIAKMATALLCGLFVARCIQSFVQARRARKQGKSLY